MKPNMPSCRKPCRTLTFIRAIPGQFYDTAKRHAEVKETLDLAENRWLELEDMRMKLEDKA
jgi:hypothetical protein